MRYFALASDYDNTMAARGRVKQRRIAVSKNPFAREAAS